MQLNLKKPCNNCPFRNDKYFPLRRAQEIANDLLRGESFQCHKTVEYDDCDDQDDDELIDYTNAEHCAGAAILLKKLNQPNKLMFYADYLYLWNPNELDMDSPVYNTIEDFVNGTKERVK